MREAVAIVPEARRVFADDGGRESGDGRFLLSATVSGAYQMGVRAASRLHERRIQRAGTMSGR